MILGQDEPNEYRLVISPQRISKLRLQIDLPMQPMFQTTDIFGFITFSPSQHNESCIIATSTSKHRSTGNPQNLMMASAWLQVCNETHPMCKTFRPLKNNWRPSRSIEIGARAGANPRLVVSKDNVGSSSVLCTELLLGDRSGYCSDSGEIQAYQEKIPITSLPATIRDTIRLSRDLGFHYLWVEPFASPGIKI
ncbi:hypothetical protein BDZ45DRAFT_748436 [Acephala macrosclerotiorum]|nr:hypothetical protein BDZ45DRAFT_748436 [Acephala macrosclerotiorum]